MLLVLLGLLISCKRNAPDQINIIPRPYKYWASEGHIKITEGTRVIYEDPNPELRLMAEYLASVISNSSSFVVDVAPLSKIKAMGTDILLVTNLNDSIYGSEGYLIQHNNRKFFSIQGNQAIGVFHGIQSFLQLFDPAIFKAGTKKDVWEIPVVYIQDQPRFSYRGMHLDVSRHIFPVAFIKKYIDLLAFYKYNYFHWHLTDDQGWRIGIKQYPRLTEIGSTRKETIVGHQGNEPEVFDGKAYGGFYTREEIKEVVGYAASKYITIVPEIEMPGHALAALSAYPELGCTGGPYETATRWGVFDDVFCTKDEVFVFLENVLTEVADLFPGPYIHIGGDEVPKTRWKACKACQLRMKQEGLHSEEELQSYFVQRIEKIVAARGKRIIGWDEILEGGLAPNATVMSWRGTEGGIAAARLGHDVIMTPGSHCYFDHYQFDRTTEPLAIGGLTQLSKVYAFEPVPDALNNAESKHILGAQANVWTEYLQQPDDISYMILPRMAAMAEVNWTPSDKRNWENFYDRLPVHFALYDAWQLKHCKAVYAPMIRSKSDGKGNKVVTIETEIPGGIIYYTTDQSAPTLQSAVFADSLVLPEASVLKVAIYRNGQKIE